MQRELHDDEWFINKTKILRNDLVQSEIFAFAVHYFPFHDFKATHAHACSSVLFEYASCELNFTHYASRFNKLISA